MPINCTANLSLFTNDLDDITGDIGRVAVVGWLLFVPQFTDGAAALGDDAAYVLRGGLSDNRSGGFKGYIDSDGILKDKPGGTAGVRIWANDPALNLERLVYRVVPDGLTDLIGRPVALNRITFEAPSTDTPINLKSVMAVPLATSVGITRGPGGDPVDDVELNVDGDLVFYVKGAQIGDPVPIPAGSGVVGTIVAGNNIDVDATDPANPVVSVEALTPADIGLSATATELNYAAGVTSAIQTQLNNKQAGDADLTALAGLAATTDNFIQAKSSAWSSRTPTQVTADLIAFVGDSGAGGAKGLVPAPGIGDATKLLRGNGTWVTISGGGDALVANPLSQFAATTSAQLRGVLSDETGTGPAVFGTAPNITAPTGIVKGDVGLGNVDNASNATERAAVRTLTNATMSGASNTFSNISADSTIDGTTNKAYTAVEKTKLGAITGTNTGDQTSVTGNAGTATTLATARNIDGQSFNGSANITVIAPGTHAATSKTTPVDADEVPLVDSAASNVLARLTWANLKATLKTYFDTLYYIVGGTDVAVTDGGTGRSTSTTAYGLIAAGTTATGAQQTLAAGATTEVLVGGGASALPVWTTATGSAAPVRATSPALTTPTLTNPTVTNYVETAQTKATVTTAKTLDPTTGTVIPLQLTASTACTVTMPTAAAGKSLLVPVYQAVTTGAGTVTFTGVKWAGGTTPTMTATALKMDVFSFWSDGNVWFGTVAQNFTP